MSLDARNIIPGFGGRLYSDKGIWLVQVPTFQCQINVTNESVQVAGSAQEQDIMQSFKVTLTMTEMLVVDDLMSTMAAALKQNTQPSFGFSGVLTRPSDGKQGRYILRNCIPQGNIDLFNVAPGKHVDRQWSFTVNDFPDLQSILT